MDSQNNKSPSITAQNQVLRELEKAIGHGIPEVDHFHMDLGTSFGVAKYKDGRIFRLELSQCALAYLPNDIKYLTSLEKLNLSKNNLVSLPASIGKLESIRGLNLTDNQLQMVPESIGGLRSLQELDLSNNQLKYLPESIGDIPFLKKLNLANNQLTALPATLGLPSHGRPAAQIDVRGNQLTHLPAAWVDLTTPRSLGCIDLGRKWLLGDNPWEANFAKLLRAITNGEGTLDSIEVFSAVKFYLQRKTRRWDTITDVNTKLGEALVHLTKHSMGETFENVYSGAIILPDEIILYSDEAWSDLLMVPLKKVFYPYPAFEDATEGVSGEGWMTLLPKGGAMAGIERVATLLAEADPYLLLRDCEYQWEVLATAVGSKAVILAIVNAVTRKSEGSYGMIGRRIVRQFAHDVLGLIPHADLPILQRLRHLQDAEVTESRWLVYHWLEAPKSLKICDSCNGWVRPKEGVEKLVEWKKGAFEKRFVCKICSIRDQE